LPDAIDQEALLQYLFYRFVPAPRTLLNGVAKVMPGSVLSFSRDGRLLEERVFTPRPSATTRFVGTPAALGDALSAAVTRQMVADVPVGAFLSGGVDSSLIVSLMRRINPDTETFAVGFPPSAEREGETAVAARAAAILATRHQARVLEPAKYFTNLPGAISIVEEPLAHPGMSLQAELAALTRTRVKVALTGQGADEPLGGYRRHQAIRIAPIVHALFGGAAETMVARRYAARRESLGRIRHLAAAMPGVTRAAAMFSPIDPAEANALLATPTQSPDEVIIGAIATWWSRAEAMDPVARALFVDTRTSLADDLLLVADKTAMAHSLETRVPFLDLEYLRTIESIDGRQRVGMLGPRKHLQIEIARRMLPSELSQSFAAAAQPWRKKRGFDAPVREWMCGSARGRLATFLHGRDACLPELLDRQQVAARLAGFLGSSGDGYRLVLAFFALEVWLRSTLRGDAAAVVTESLIPHVPECARSSLKHA
jgi:asparagine synthase (glutamine-hydrolysing)